MQSRWPPAFVSANVVDGLGRISANIIERWRRMAIREVCGCDREVCATHRGVSRCDQVCMVRMPYVCRPDGRCMRLGVGGACYAIAKYATAIREVMRRRWCRHRVMDYIAPRNQNFLLGKIWLDSASTWL